MVEVKSQTVHLVDLLHIRLMTASDCIRLYVEEVDQWSHVFFQIFENRISKPYTSCPVPSLNRHSMSKESIGSLEHGKQLILWLGLQWIKWDEEEKHGSDFNTPQASSIDTCSYYI